MNDRLTLIGVIDSGLYGRVYKAEQVDLERIVAVKIIKPDYPDVADAIAHAKKLVQIGPHNNLVTVFGVEYVTIDKVGVNLPAVVMEWLDGENLGQRLNGPRFTPQETRRICTGMFDAVEHMHAAGIAHGDLHPGNIILLSDCTPKIIDVDPNRDNTLSRLSTISRSGAIVNDLGYCRNNAMLVFRQARFSIAATADLDLRLQDADNLDTIRQSCDDFIDDRLSSPTLGTIVPIPTSLGRV